MLLKDRTAIITGGAKGMGRGMALRFAKEGCSIAIADIDINQAEAAVAEVKKGGGEGLAVHCDVTNGDQVKETVEQVLNRFDHIDILVNNAGAIGNHMPVEDIPEEDWDKILALNLKSIFLFCKFVVPGMKKRRYGKIINISSIGAIQPPAHEIHYNTAKSGSIGFTMDLSATLAPLNINVNVILPGPIRTSFYDKFVGSMSEQEKDDFFKMLGKKVPMQRVGTPEDIAGAALFLASELSSYVTGQTLMVSGGLPLQPFSPLH